MILIGYSIQRTANRVIENSSKFAIRYAMRLNTRETRGAWLCRSSEHHWSSNPPYIHIYNLHIRLEFRRCRHFWAEHFEVELCVMIRVCENVRRSCDRVSHIRSTLNITRITRTNMLYPTMAWAHKSFAKLLYNSRSRAAWSSWVAGARQVIASMVHIYRRRIAAA